MEEYIRRFSNYRGQIYHHDLVLAYLPPFELTAAIVLDIEDEDESTARAAITPVSSQALQTIMAFGIDSFIQDVNLIDYPVIQISVNSLKLVKSEDVGKCDQLLLEYHSRMSQFLMQTRKDFTDF